MATTGRNGQRGHCSDRRLDAELSNGYVRFYNDQGQPIDLDGKPTGQAATHVPRNIDGSYPLPKGWQQ